MGFKLAQTTPTKPPLKEETPAPLPVIEAIEPPAPPEPSPEEIAKLRLDEAKNRIGKITPELIADVRLLIDEYIDELAGRDAGCGIPLAVLRNTLTARGGQCQCRNFLINTGVLK
jgi:hypothetical protein